MVNVFILYLERNGFFLLTEKNELVNFLKSMVSLTEVAVVLWLHS